MNEWMNEWMNDINSSDNSMIILAPLKWFIHVLHLPLVYIHHIPSPKKNNKTCQFEKNMYIIVYNGVSD